MGEELDERTWRAAVSVLPPVGWQTAGGMMVGVGYRSGMTVVYARRAGGSTSCMPRPATCLWMRLCAV
jgi:hypothetical protein